MDQDKIGKFIAECRKEKSFTQAALAEQLGITDRAVSKWERGKNMPDLSIMPDLCELLGISVNELLTGEHIEMEDYRNMERCSGEPCCIFAERICADNEKEILKMEKDTKEKVTADEMMDDLIYLAELIDFMGITSCLAVRRTLSERMTDKLTDSIAGMADEVLEKWEDYQDKTE